LSGWIFAQKTRLVLILDNMKHWTLEKISVQKTVKYLYLFFVDVHFKVSTFSKKVSYLKDWMGETLLRKPAQFSYLTIWNIELLRRDLCRKYWNISTYFLLTFILKYRHFQIIFKKNQLLKRLNGWNFAQQPRPVLILDNMKHWTLEKRSVQKTVKYLYPFFDDVDFKESLFSNQ
jgi:hypothetical protein